MKKTVSENVKRIIQREFEAYSMGKDSRRQKLGPYCNPYPKGSQKWLAWVAGYKGMRFED